MKIRFAGVFYNVQTVSRCFDGHHVLCLTNIGWVMVDLDAVGLYR